MQIYYCCCYIIKTTDYYKVKIGHRTTQAVMASQSADGYIRIWYYDVDVAWWQLPCHTWAGGF